ncbi:PhoX family protein [Streptomyces sp. NPDC127097]|uniref:PhoX family protein n=1 Tax=Streptomyces sp. NPDC127097 TaxID=3347136 RepID=UPI0036642312
MHSRVGKSAATCRLKCGQACAGQAPNTSGNVYFGEVLRQVVSRRWSLKAGTVTAGALAAAPLTGTPRAAAAGPEAAGPAAEGPAAEGTAFTPVPTDTGDRVVVPEGYRHEVLIRWGDPVLRDAPPFDFDRQTAAAQARQFGVNNDFCALLPLRGHDRWLMVSNHEYASEPLMFGHWDPDRPTEEQVRTAWEAHGLSVVLLERAPGEAVPRVRTDARWNRRITLTTPCEVRGPAAGSRYLRTSADPEGVRVLGTMANCSGGKTPWGTVLSGEENVHVPFAHADAAPTAQERAALRRYGFAPGPSLRKWERHDRRFDLGREPNEANRFGWIVEIDPYDPHSTPVKHTALGRFKHEAANIVVAPDGRVTAYMGDDERFEYLYKFVSDRRMRTGGSAADREHNTTLLDSGTLYAARFSGDSPAGETDGSGRLPADGEFDGSGRWLPLAHNSRSFVDGMTAEEVYVFTRQAADRAGATAMDRPEDVQPHPETGRVYAALTNNDYRGAAGAPAPDEANPRATNRDGHVLELEEHGGDATAERFRWRLMLVCGDPAAPGTYYAGYDKSRVSALSCPDNIAFDRHGNLWLTTDNSGRLGNDGLYVVPTEGPERGRVKRFMTIPVGAEACGPVIEDDFVLLSVQHPGEVEGADAQHPASHWPDGGTSRPRAAVVAVWRPDGGGIGMSGPSGA